MSPERDIRGHGEEEYDDPDYGEEPPRSVFATTWFRAILVVVVLALVGILALPYLLDWVTPTRLNPAIKAPVVGVPSPPRGTEPVGSPSAPPATGTSAAGPGAAKPAAPLVAGTSQPKPESPAPTGAQAPPAVATMKPSAPAAGGRTEASRPLRVAKVSPARRPTKAEAPGGMYWVQVGAFHEETHAKALAAKLRGENFSAEVLASSGGREAAAAPEPATASSVADKYDVFVSGVSSEEVNAKLAGKGLSAEPVAGGAVIKPSLSLRDAVSLSKDLASEGMKVQVRRTPGGAAVERAAQAPPSGGEAYYRVRVVGFADRAAAEEARKALGAKGYNAFVGRGGG